MKFKEWTRPIRKFDDIYYTIERIIYGRGKLSGFTSEDIYNNLHDKRFFRDAADLHNYLLAKGKTYRIRPKDGGWERIW
ncbi:MAG: hypothetical protein NQU42_01195 [Methanothrix sp.]|jgi:hypothetical protein|uniref:hypothetical protein n=1 Tax=Methanothrix sp. TaxID=90426 RepID=UPI0025CBD20A|nr:hypothetical protein [Methanothrix sp.]MCQ8902702.1 hypothetical protein [Methanothrix sp.]MCX8206246.1 hypothetical protein [Methanothrix sp.]MDI9616068.1 hypothetical protein [Methanothrix sp.]